jgi:hypothetical protein
MNIQYNFPDLSARRADSFFNMVFASLPMRPSVETTNGVEWRRCSRQGSRYFRFFSRSCASKTLYGSLERLDLASVSVIAKESSDHDHASWLGSIRLETVTNGETILKRCIGLSPRIALQQPSIHCSIIYYVRGFGWVGVAAGNVFTRAFHFDLLHAPRKNRCSHE